MRLRWAFLLVCAGCGRIGFDKLATDATVEVPEPVDFDTPFGEEVAQVQLNSGGGEEDPSLTDDMLEIVFERDNLLFVATRPDQDALWEPPSPLEEINNGGNVSTPEISGDGLRLDFSSNRAPSLGGGDFFRSTRSNRDAPWNLPVHLVLSSSASEDSMSTDDMDTLAVFVRSAGGTGGSDLYLARRAADGEYQAATELVSLNSAVDELGPFFHDRGQSIFFSTASRGGKDLMRATRPDPSSPFDAPVPVPGLATPERESDPWVSPDGRVIFYSANRGGGNADLFMATRGQ